MRWLAIPLILVPLLSAHAASKGSDDEACTQGQKDLAPKAAEFKGEERIKRLIVADLRRARKEQDEGDADECLEAIEHAKKLLSGKF